MTEITDIDHNLLESFRKRRIAVLLDEFSTPSRAVLVAAAHDISPDVVNQLAGLARGLVFVAVSPERAAAFMLAPMSRPLTDPTARFRRRAFEAESYSALNFCESVEAREGVTTGISMADRARTISVLGEPSPAPRQVVKPGHIFPVQVREGGVLERHALAEGALDLVKMSGETDAAAFCDLLNQHGDLMDLEAAKALAEARGIPCTSLGALTVARLRHEKLVFKVAEARLPTRLAGEMRSCVYRATIHSGEHVALIKGEIDPALPVLTRVQPEFTINDVFGGGIPPSRDQLQRSLKAIADNGSGILLYLRRPDLGELLAQIQLGEKYQHQRQPYLIREYGLGAQILSDLGVKKVELLTSSERSYLGLRPFGMEVVGQRPIP